MNIILIILLFSIGLAMLIKGADWLVGGASSISLRLKIKPIVVGLTVVAFGTSAPELMVSLSSLFAGSSGIALGNIIGSNIANTLLILGVGAIIYPLTVGRNTVLKEIPMSVLGVVVLFVLGMQSLIDFGGSFDLSNILFQSNLEGYISRADGLILLLFFSIFVYYTVTIAKNVGGTSEDLEIKPLKSSIVFILLGIAGLMLGSKLTVDNAIILAKILGISDNLIGLTLIAIGTSLPELVTSVVAALKKNADILIGNVVGSNIFNVFFVLGTVSILKPIPFFTPSVFDVLFLLLVTVIVFVSLFAYRKHRITRADGVILLIIYVLYIGFIIVRG